MSSKNKALFALSILMIGLFSVEEAQARFRLFGRLRARIQERREARFGNFEAQEQQGNKEATGNQEGKKADGKTGNQVATQVAPASAADMCNFNFATCVVAEAPSPADPNKMEKRNFCQTPIASLKPEEEVLRMTAAGTLVVLRDGKLSEATERAIRFMAVQFANPVPGGAPDPRVAKFQAKYAALLARPENLLACQFGNAFPGQLGAQAFPALPNQILGGGLNSYANLYNTPLQQPGALYSPPVMPLLPQQNPIAPQQPAAGNAPAQQGGLFGDTGKLGQSTPRPLGNQGSQSATHGGADSMVVQTRQPASSEGKLRPRAEKSAAPLDNLVGTTPPRSLQSMQPKS